MTRRFGYKKAKGEYIVNCDSDDLLEPDFFEVLMKTIKEYSQFSDILSICLIIESKHSFRYFSTL